MQRPAEPRSPASDGLGGRRLATRWRWTSLPVLAGIVAIAALWLTRDQKGASLLDGVLADIQHEADL